MAEQIQLAGPDQTRAGSTQYQVHKIEIHAWNVDNQGGFLFEPNIRVSFVGDDGSLRVLADNDPAVLRALNKADLSTTSLEKRLMEKALAEDIFDSAGTLTGTPD